MSLEYSSFMITSIYYQFFFFRIMEKKYDLSILEKYNPLVYFFFAV